MGSYVVDLETEVALLQRELLELGYVESSSMDTFDPGKFSEDK
jgi:hypothetical protein